VVQQQLKTQLDIRGAAIDQYSQEQHMIAQQVKANGQAVAHLTLHHFKNENKLEVDNESVSVLYDEKPDFQNVFAELKNGKKPESSKTKRSLHTFGHKSSGVKTAGDKTSLTR